MAGLAVRGSDPVKWGAAGVAIGVLAGVLLLRMRTAETAPVETDAGNLSLQDLAKPRRPPAGGQQLHWRVPSAKPTRRWRTTPCSHNCGNNN